MPEFIIHRIEYGLGDIRAIGRCGDEPISIGTVFRCAWRRPMFRKEGGAQRENERGVELRVESIDTFGRELGTLESGLNGRLRLAGEGADLIESGDSLTTDDPPSISGG